MIYRDVTHGENLFWSYWSSESYQALYSDLDALVSLLGVSGRLPSGVISDWKGSIVSGVATYFPGIPQQRCLAHVVREAKRLLPEKSSFEGVLALRVIAKQLPYIKTHKEPTGWKSQLIKWELAYGHLLKEKTINPDTGKKWWYTHGDLRRAWRLLTDDWYPFFVHLDHLLLPNTNNSLEGVNSQLKNKLLNHRGMKTPQQVSFLFWYLTFTRTTCLPAGRKTRQKLKKIWDVWKD